MSSTTTASPISTTLPAMPSPTFTSTGPRRPPGARARPRYAGLALAVEQHDRPDASAHGAHRALENVREQVLDSRDAGGHLDHLVERTELEHEVLEPLGRRAQLEEHAPEGLGDLADLVHLTEAGHRRGRGPLRRGSRRRELFGRSGRQRLSEGAARSATRCVSRRKRT